MDYELLDYGAGFKLERFGAVTLMRPDPALFEPPQAAINSWTPDSMCTSLGGGRFAWEPLLGPWVMSYDALKVELRLSQSQNIGIFPEQEANWRWLAQQVKPGAKILNLFAYTGVATLVCAQAGAEVCHVDASKSAVRWASDNARLSGLADKSIRWMVEDARIFLKREAARGKHYDGIILDPPPFGHSRNNPFLFRRDITELLNAAKQVLAPEPDFFLLNSYAQNLSPRQLGELLRSSFWDQDIETGELQIGELALSTYARLSFQNG